jgi:hypothetical protein
VSLEYRIIISAEGERDAEQIGEGERRDGSALAAGPGCDLPLFTVTLRFAFNRGNPLLGATTPAHVHVLKAG